MLVVIGWVRSRRVVQMSDPLSVTEEQIIKHYIAVIIHRLVETQPDVEVKIYFKLLIHIIVIYSHSFVQMSDVCSEGLDS